ncbi:MAG TPA: hypothetical protein VJA16_01245 [Thermoanaerobaculia bacterium]
MPGSEQSTPPLWNESDSFRETLLQLFDDPADREVVRRAGRVLYDLALDATRENGTTPEDPSITRAELRAIATDLRHAGGCCAYVRRSIIECSLDEPDEKLARFAGKIGARVAALVEKIERRLS